MKNIQNIEKVQSRVDTKRKAMQTTQTKIERLEAYLELQQGYLQGYRDKLAAEEAIAVKLEGVVSEVDAREERLDEVRNQMREMIEEKQWRPGIPRSEILDLNPEYIALNDEVGVLTEEIEELIRDSGRILYRGKV